MTDMQKRCLALFYCQQVPGSSEQERLAIEKEYGKNIRLFPIPCSGRLEPIHLLKALEEFADMAYVITCPEGECRYFEGNRRAQKRVERTRAIITDIGLEAERVGIIVGSKDNPKSLVQLAREVFERTLKLQSSPVLDKVSRMG
ncbi:MAG: hydrogenase iron-sulfur subunit [Desulfobulbaceae bacterium]|nr:hydrogenase iron-sulfur subunit [Desulfobulbaceae bacterium]